MKIIKNIFNLIIILSLSITTAFSEITASTPTNIIQKIASATSFTSTSQSSAQNANVIQNTTSNVINGKELRKKVEQDAKAFGLLVNEAVLARESGVASTNKQMVQIGGPKNLYEGREDLEPTLDTIVYDTGLMTLTKEGGHYNDDSSNTIFDATSGAQQARIKVYVDFKRKVLWGDVESRITLTGASQMTNTYTGSSAAITSLPVDKELLHTVSSTTGLPLDRTIDPSLNGNAEPYPYLKNNNNFLNSLLDANGNIASYDPAYAADDLADMVKNVAHGTGGDKNVLVQARFLTTGSGTPGKSVASFEASNAASCGSSCSTSEQNTFKDSVVRYSTTVETTAKKYKEE
tara:strand:+ start:1589 stop:2632 length:1044 start_codon:yes stop_codon:yes gene_type:complete